MNHFYDRLLACFPADLQPPEPLLRYFRWCEEQGLERNYNGHIYGLTDPSQTCSHIYLTTTYADWWMDDPATAGRVVPFCRTGGDGSYAALWRDDEGEARIVHMGSGSGSVTVGLLGQTPVDFLRLLAIGYEELCWPDQHTLTPLEVFYRNNGEDAADWDEDEQPPVRPDALRAWLASEFGVSVPATAWDIVGHMPDMGASTPSADPFWQWLSRLQDWDVQA